MSTPIYGLFIHLNKVCCLIFLKEVIQTEPLDLRMRLDGGGDGGGDGGPNIDTDVEVTICLSLL